MSRAASTTFEWRIGPARSLPLDQPGIMGVLNVTPDSFSDGGLHLDRSAAAEHALRMQDRGAAIIDIGGESTRPGAASISPDEQIARVLPVIETIRKRTDLPISIDTTSAVVAKAALEAGADIINDISAGRDDHATFALAASRGCGLILMHRLRPPVADSFSDRYADEPRYKDVVMEVRDFWLSAPPLLERAGVDRAAIVIDPGLGFGKSVAQNYELIAGARAFVDTGYPVLCGASRKSFIGRASGVEEPAHRVSGSIAAAVVMFMQGVRLFRVHDVAEHREAFAVAEAIRAGNRHGN